MNPWMTGPWVAHGRMVDDANNNAVAMVNLAMSDDYASAHARLLAAAPALYEALRRLLIETGEGGRRGRAIDLLPRETIEQARAALAKAEGKS